MNPDKVESKRKRRRVVNIVEFGNGELVYIRLDDGKKYLLNGDGCWRCGSTAKCFGNMDDNELEVICEFDFYDEVRSLFLLLLQDRLNRSPGWLRDGIKDESCRLIEGVTELSGRFVDLINVIRNH